MKLNYLLIISAFAVSLLFGACKSSSINAYYPLETTCMGNNMDGSVIVRVNGMGATNAAAIREAKKRAVYDIVFNGLRNGQCNYRALVLEPNAKEKYESYFNSFFSDRGDFIDYVVMDATKMGSKESYSAKTHNSYVIVVRVLRSELENKLINDNIIKK